MKPRTQRHGVGVVLCILLAIVAGCGTDPVTMVREGTLDRDKSVTVGNALDGYKHFTRKAWSTFQDAQKRTIVQFTGTVRLDAYKDMTWNQYGFLPWTLSAQDVEDVKQVLRQLDYVVQFAIERTGDRFAVSYSGYELHTRTPGSGEEKSADVKDEQLEGLASIFRNELDPYILRSLIELAGIWKQHQGAGG